MEKIMRDDVHGYLLLSIGKRLNLYINSEWWASCKLEKLGVDSYKIGSTVFAEDNIEKIIVVGGDDCSVYVKK